MRAETAVPTRETTSPRVPVSTKSPRGKRYLNSLLAEEISELARYYDRVIQWLPREEDGGLSLSKIDSREKRTVGNGEVFPDLGEEDEQRTAILINGTLNHYSDIQGLLSNLKTRLSRSSRVLLVLYNPYLRWLYALANRLGIRKGDLPSTFLTRVDLENLARLSGFSVVRQRRCGYFPWRMFGMTMPPELLRRYCQAYWEGLADFINGSRLSIPWKARRCVS
jgi:hypothetical protein